MTTKTSTEIIYPETDGMPLPDGVFQDPLFREIVSTIATYFKDQPNTVVSGNTFIYYEEGNPRRSVSPDCYVVYDSDVELLLSNNTYRLWEMGKPPDFALEIASVSTATVDTGSKRELYARLGIPEYWRYDSTGGDFYGEPLVGEYLVDGEYRRFEMRHEPDGRVWGRSPALNLDLWWDDGRLHFWNPKTGRWLLNQEEAQAALEAERAARQSAEARLDQERARLDQERARADQQRARADQERARADALKAELRRLRGQQP